MWRHRGKAWNLLAGADAQRVEGTSTDRLVPTGLRVGGGSQVQHGVFAQLDAGTPTAKVFLGARHQFTGSDNRFFSPSGGFTVGRGVVRGRGSVYRSFRAPTLNELYRDFRAGNAETRANAALRPETLFGAEVGVDVVGENSRLAVGLYRNEIANIITNVTLSSTPALIVRQRQNAASALTRGIDAQGDYRRGPWRFDLGYLYAESRFSTRERIPQVPKHSGNAQLTYSSENTLVSGGLRSFSLQFEDDRNQFRAARICESAAKRAATRQTVVMGNSGGGELVRPRVPDGLFSYALDRSSAVVAGGPALGRSTEALVREGFHCNTRTLRVASVLPRVNGFPPVTFCRKNSVPFLTHFSVSAWPEAVAAASIGPSGASTWTSTAIPSGTRQETRVTPKPLPSD
jgi:hypothetical protein